ncbi:alpha/beta hydrolase [Mucilaginibacter sp. SG564]|uniref:alpha/beta hydrolase n=1 Tax=Mucilaginibacter sp. 22184 TaxID=3453887 RepID=UPI001553A986|nr:acetyl esterase/lipase [Mucilaginibacter sp. SG564]
MKPILSVFILMIATAAAYSQEKAIPLYPKGVPNSKPTPATYVEVTENNWIKYVSQPTITPYLPAKGTANGTAVVVCPGGGYSGLASAHEGSAIAEAFNKIGVTAYLLKYRLPSDEIMKDKSIGPLQDAQTAILMVRKHAAEWGIDPNKIGIIGFSAGGHLASTAGTHFDKPVIETGGISVRPDFMILAYPVITFGEFAHTGSRENLIGKTPSAAQIDLYSNEKQVTSNTPPTFIMHSQDDDVVPVQNSLLLYDALLKNKVKVEMHLFQQTGSHGIGLNNPKNKGKWFDWAANWLEQNGFLKGK